MSRIWAELNMIVWPQLERRGTLLLAASHVFALKSTFLVLILFRIKMAARFSCFICMAENSQIIKKAYEPHHYVGVALPF